MDVKGKMMNWFGNLLIGGGLVGRGWRWFGGRWVGVGFWVGFGGGRKRLGCGFVGGGIGMEVWWGEGFGYCLVGGGVVMWFGRRRGRRWGAVWWEEG